MPEFFYNEDTKMLKGFPVVTKKGAVSPNGESSPFVWHGRLMRLELEDRTCGTDLSNKSHAIIRDCETGEIFSRFAEGTYYNSFYCENDKVYVLATKSGENELCGDTILIFESSDLKNWETKTLISQKGSKFYNTSLTKGEDCYMLLLEFGPYPFNYTFAKSKDLINWNFLSEKCNFGKGRYVGGPFMRYCNGYYYIFSVEELPAKRYATYIYRTKDFLNYESGFYNPLLMPDENDRKIADNAFEINEELKEKIKTGFISSNSDFDLCEFDGKTKITYNVGNQLGFYYLAEAEYDGTVQEFLENNFI